MKDVVMMDSAQLIITQYLVHLASLAVFGWLQMGRSTNFSLPSLVTVSANLLKRTKRTRNKCRLIFRLIC